MLADEVVEAVQLVRVVGVFARLPLGVAVARGDVEQTGLAGCVRCGGGAVAVWMPDPPVDRWGLMVVRWEWVDAAKSKVLLAFCVAGLVLFAPP